MVSQRITTEIFDCRYVCMISPHIPTTCQPALLAEVLTWVPLPPASQKEKSIAACTAVFVWLSIVAVLHLMVRPTPPPFF